MKNKQNTTGLSLQSFNITGMAPPEQNYQEQSLFGQAFKTNKTDRTEIELNTLKLF